MPNNNPAMKGIDPLKKKKKSKDETFNFTTTINGSPIVMSCHKGKKKMTAAELAQRTQISQI